MVTVHCTSKSNGGGGGGNQNENFKNLSKNASIFGMKHLVNIYQVCKNYGSGAKHGPTPGKHKKSEA